MQQSRQHVTRKEVAANNYVLVKEGRGDLDSNSLS